jgi:hypothetical protein
MGEGAEGPGLSLRDGMDLSGMTITQLWLRYVGLGGCQTPSDLQQEVFGSAHVDSREHNLLAQAINEHFLDNDQAYPVAYRRSPFRP